MLALVCMCVGVCVWLNVCVGVCVGVGVALGVSACVAVRAGVDVCICVVGVGVCAGVVVWRPCWC